MSDLYAPLNPTWEVVVTIEDTLTLEPGLWRLRVKPTASSWELSAERVESRCAPDLPDLSTTGGPDSVESLFEALRDSGERLEAEGRAMCDALALVSRAPVWSFADAWAGPDTETAPELPAWCPPYHPLMVVTPEAVYRWTLFSGTSREVKATGCSPGDADRQARGLAIREGWGPPRWWQWWRRNDWPRE